MARFIGKVQGSKGDGVTRLGDSKSGMMVYCDGWKAGVTVISHVNSAGLDVFRIYATSGSDGTGGRVRIATRIDGKLDLEPIV